MSAQNSDYKNNEIILFLLVKMYYSTFGAFVYRRLFKQSLSASYIQCGIYMLYFNIVLNFGIFQQYDSGMYINQTTDIY